MSISVIVTWTKGDPERLEGLQMMWECIRKQTFRDFELILAEMSRDGTTTYLPYKPDNHIVRYYDGIFNKSWMSNIAIKEAKHDLILSLDADTIFGDDYFQKLVDYYNEFKNPFFNPWNKIKMLTGRDEPTERWVEASYMRAAAHAWFVEKKFFWDIGGMNEKYFGYGAEDQDLWERALHRLKYVAIMPYTLVHVYHHFHPKESAFPLNEKRVELLEETKNNIDREIEKLVSRVKYCGGEKPNWIPE